ncbi:MAG: PD40 domain-containing protein, partial [Bacteroidales bacterium]|nr:PD40 domain-containing protein [Bacteroidales bacterium]
MLCNGYWAEAQDSPSYYSYPQHHLPWYTLESNHFLVHFQQGNSRSAQVASRVAEEVYPHITELYRIEPDSKTSIVLNDREDYSNGAAYFFDNQIDIWIPALDSPLRGTHDWLRNVISHEFTHIVQLKASMKKSRKLPAIYFQWLSYEDVRRPDVLYGYPNGLITYPFSSISVPGWFAEGTAQYQRTGWTFDTWDSHRDMILRTALLNDTYLSFEDMGTFTSKTSLEREQVYNQGFAFTSYLALQYGETVFSEISEALSRPGIFNIDNAMEQVTGKNGQVIFQNWISQRKKFYKQAVESIEPENSQLIESEGFMNFYPAFSPDGSKIAYLSNKELTESGVSLYIRPFGDSAEDISKIELGPFRGNNVFPYGCGFHDKPLISRIRAAYSFSPDGESLIFTRANLNQFGEQYNDLFFYHLETRKTEQLTSSARIHDPAWHPDGSHIAAVQVEHGTANLVLVDPKTGS